MQVFLLHQDKLTTEKNPHYIIHSHAYYLVFHSSFTFTPLFFIS